MDYIFFNNSGAVLFVRNDIEMGQWTQEEYTVNMTFPYIPGKVIAEGQRVAFRDPATDSLEFFEIRNVQNTNPDGFQQFTAEHIVIAELTYEHINTTEITDKTPAQALSTVLTGTLWSVGNSAVSAVNSVDISRGDVWQAVKAIEANFNVYITPRVVVNSAGFITGRYLDITDAQNPVFRGVRLSIDANMLDDTVIYDDSDVYTALYGYGGSVDVPQTGGQQDKTEELTFKDVVWTQTAQHPAKPAGQTYIEDRAKTALYGHNGRPRFGYYQNSNIKDANTLLQKTWETLQNSKPKISISGTVVDYYRLGYGGQPVRLHDKAIVEVSPTGEVFSLQVIRNTVNLVDPTATRPEIGDYIPNIIYINRQTNERATGGGGGGRHGQTNIEHEDGEIYSSFEKMANGLRMVVGLYNGGYKVEAGQIALAINESNEAEAYIDAAHINISATQTVRTLAGAMHIDTNGKLVIDNAGGMYVQRTESGVTSQFGVWDKGNLTGGVMVQNINGQNTLKLIADVIDIQGIVNALTSYNLTTETLHATNTLTIEGEATFSNGVTCTDGSGLDGGYVNVTDVDTTTLTVDGEDAAWQTYTARYCTMTGSQKYILCSNGANNLTPSSAVHGYIVGSLTNKVIHYLGKAPANPS